MSTSSIGLAIATLVVAAVPAAAQVAYVPGAPVYLGYPVPGGFLQPNEVLGTSPSYEILPTPDGYPPAVRVVQRCQYHDGWNTTDFGRDINGIPNGIDHTCPAPVIGRRAVHGRY